MVLYYWCVYIGSMVILLSGLNMLSRRIRFVLRSILFAIGFVFVIPLLLIPLMIVKPGDVRNARFTKQPYAILSRLLGINWDVRGKENIPDDNHVCIILCNHQAGLDILPFHILLYITERMGFVAKRELFYVWPLGLMLWLIGTTFLDRWNPSEGHATINKAASYALKTKTKLLIFPEGTRGGSARKTLMPFKKGAFHIAIENKIPILPMVIAPYTFLENGRWTKYTVKVPVQLLPPIPTAHLKLEDLNNLLNLTQDKMESTYQQLRKEVTT